MSTTRSADDRTKWGQLRPSQWGQISPSFLNATAESRKGTPSPFRRTIAQEGESIPIFLAAVQRRMLHLAGAKADGVLLNVCTTPMYYDRVALPYLKAGAEAAGRRLEDVCRKSLVCAAVSDDPSEAREWARRHIAFYGSLPYFDLIFRMHGFAAEAAVLRDAAERGDAAAGIAAVNQEMVNAFTIAGTPDDVRRRLRDWSGYIETAVLFPPSHMISPDEIVANYNAIRDTFAQ